jgi:hypothetical protein
MTTTMPFGKFKGEPLEIVRSDEAYRRWLVQQPWVAARFPEIHRFLAGDELNARNSYRGTKFRFERVITEKAGFVARPRCLVCDREFDVPLGSIQAVFKIGREFIGVACGDCAAVPRQEAAQ